MSGGYSGGRNDYGLGFDYPPMTRALIAAFTAMPGMVLSLVPRVNAPDMPRDDDGLALLDSARAAGAIETTPLAITEIIRMQPHQARRKRQILSRLAAMAVVGWPAPRYRGLQLWAAAARESPIEQARSFAGLVRRFMQGRA